MNMSRLIQRSISLASVAGIAGASVAAAQWGRQAPRQSMELFEWTGRVDREVQIVMRGDRVWTNNIGRTEPNNERSRTHATLPRQQGQIALQVTNGRGRVDVIQQPTSQNGYTAIVRIQDPNSGSDAYRLAAYWQGYGYGNGDVYSRDDDRSHGRRGDEMRRRDDDDWDRDGRRGTVMHWSGNVDDELEIRLQNGRVDYRTIRGAQPTSIRVNAANAGNVSRSPQGTQFGIATSQGRGTVTVVQQPSVWNGNTTVIRVRDPQGGYGYYDFDLIWR